MIIEAKSPYQPVPLGHTGENIARTVVFDITTWVDRYGSGGVLLLAKRPGDAEPYPVPVIQERERSSGRCGGKTFSPAATGRRSSAI